MDFDAIIDNPFQSMNHAIYSSTSSNNNKKNRQHGYSIFNK